MEKAAIILLWVTIAVILCEAVWLVVIASRQERQRKTETEDRRAIKKLCDALTAAGGDTALDKAVEDLSRFVNRNGARMERAAKTLLACRDECGDSSGGRALDNLKAAEQALDIPSFFSGLLQSGSAYEKAHACRVLADFCVEAEKDRIARYTKSKNKALAYNAAMAMAVFGDETAVAEYMFRCRDNYQLSHRIILELLDNYTGDLLSLGRRILQFDDEYIRIAMIKGLADCAFEEFEDMYLAGLDSANDNMKAACVRALARIGKPAYEHAIITAAHDRSWVVRSAAIQGLGSIHTHNARMALVNAAQDPEWWVRYNAARTLVEVDEDLVYTEMVLGGYDKYGTDVMKYVLYRTFDFNEDAAGKEPAI